MYDPCHPIIDNVFFEFTGVVASDPSFTIEQQTGDFGRATIDLAVNVICAEGYNGTDCNTFCEEINGVLTCREDDVPTAPSIVNPTSSGTICTTGDPPATSGPITDLTSPSIQATSGQETDNNIDLTSTLSQGTGDSMTVALTGGLAERGSDNTLAIALGVGIGGAVLLCLLVGLIILLLCLVCRVRRKKQKSKYLV